MFKKTALDRIPRYKRTALKGGVPIFGFVLPKYNFSNLSDSSRSKIKSLRLLDPNYIFIMISKPIEREPCVVLIYHGAIRRGLA